VFGLWGIEKLIFCQKAVVLVEQLKTVMCKVRIDFVVLLVFGTFATRRRRNASVNYTTSVDTHISRTAGQVSMKFCVGQL
jgi:hypothetical protein